LRALLHPGPIHPRRIESFGDDARELTYTVAPGVSLLRGLTGPLDAAGFQAATLRFSGAAVGPFHYVMPDHAKDAEHVAYFSEPRAPIGTTRIEQARATFGFHLGQPFLHCHAVWIEPDGQRRGGHILNDETILNSSVEVTAFGFSNTRIATAEDPETNFSLLQPSGKSAPGANAVLARVRPNEDITAAVEMIARAHDMPNAAIVGSVGSLVGTRFDDGHHVADHATEVLITSGELSQGMATIEIISIDMAGRAHDGRVTRGENPVCITFDIVMIRR
jgi:predicted DNA-binding protein with PD1-like motif